MDFQDGFASIQVRCVHDYLPVEAARTQQRAVQYIGPVGGTQDNHSGIGLETSHLDQQLVEGLLALIIDRTHVDTALAADGVQLINKDNAGGLRLGLLEEVPNTSRADTDEHLDEITAAQGEKDDLRLTGH